MFSSLRSRLWLSYALLVVTALSVVAVILFVYLIRNPFLYRQTLERLQAVQTVVMERDGQPISVVAERASKTFNVRILLFSADRQTLLDTYGKGNPRFRSQSRNCCRAAYRSSVTRKRQRGCIRLSSSRTIPTSWLPRRVRAFR